MGAGRRRPVDLPARGLAGPRRRRRPGRARHLAGARLAGAAPGDGRRAPDPGAPGRRPLHRPDGVGGRGVARHRRPAVLDPRRPPLGLAAPRRRRTGRLVRQPRAAPPKVRARHPLRGPHPRRVGRPRRHDHPQGRRRARGRGRPRPAHRGGGGRHPRRGRRRGGRRGPGGRPVRRLVADLAARPGVGPPDPRRRPRRLGRSTRSRGPRPPPQRPGAGPAAHPSRQ